MADDVLGHRMSPYYPGNDSQGFRNPSVPERCDILTIGDSFTYGFAATPENSWPRQLERLTRRPTYNMSCGGYGFCEYEVLLERGLSLKPRRVIVGLTIGTDMAETYRSAYREGTHCPAQRFQSHDSALLETLRQTEEARPFSDISAVVQASDDTSSGLRRCVSTYSSLYALLRVVRSAAVAGEYLSPLREGDPPQDSFEICSRRPARLVYDDNPKLRTVFFDPEFLRSRIDPDDVRIQEGKRISEEILLSMRTLVEQANARFLVVILPTKSIVYSELMSTATPAPPQAFSRYNEAEQRLTRSIEEFLDAHNIDYVNSTSALRERLARNEPTHPESDDGHPNKNGYAAIAGAILPWVERGQ
jgi:hypothetical protein